MEPKTNETPKTEDITPEASEPIVQPDSQGSNEGKEAEKTFTQSHVNAMTTKARKEAKAAATRDLLEATGLDDIESLKTILESERKRKEAEMSDVEKAQTTIDELNKQLDEEKQARQLAEEQRIQSERNTLIASALKAAGSEHPEDLVLIAKSIGVSFEDAWDDDGKLDQKVFDQALADLKAKRPAAFTPTTPGSPSNTGGKISSPDTIDKTTIQRITSKFGKP